MTARPTWVRKLYWTLGVVTSLALVAVCYAFVELTAEVELDASKKPNELDAKEASRKLKLYNDAMAISRRGFIRLSAVEINSYLHQHFFAEPDRRETHTSPPTSPRLLNSRVELANGGLVWSCWLRKDCLGRSVDLVWERVFELKQFPNRSQLQPKSMRVGRLEVPPRLWGFVEQQLGEVDKTFTGQTLWLTQLPTFEIRTNEASISPELRLFTYAVPSPSKKTTP